MMVISETKGILVIGQLNGNMNDKYLTYFEGDLLPSRDANGVVFDTKYLMDLLGVAMKESGSKKEPHQVELTPKTNKYKYLLIGC